RSTQHSTLFPYTTLFRSDDLVDPCWPERYNYAARCEVNAAMAPQVQNGHILDQTVYDSMFECGTDRLHKAGIDHLIYLAERRPRSEEHTSELQSRENLVC